jgi:glycosyltransferase involved in cell wall biosynthesis
MADVVIAIPTFRRPRGLARLLASLADLRTCVNVTVIVGDNDAAIHQGQDLCAQTRARGYRWPLECIVVAERGIAQNRNALVAAALEKSSTEFLAMLDDDEWVEPDWLDALLETRSLFAADAIEGPVRGVHEDGSAAQDYAGVASHRGASGPVECIEGAGNVLIARSALERLSSPWFDPAFALSGGEDKDFFQRLKAQGARFAWSAEAVSYTAVPESRTGLKWTLARAYGVGNSDMRVFLKHQAGPGSMLREIAKIAGALLLSPPAALLHWANPDRRLKALSKLYRAAGKTAALFGSHYQEYSVIHGE